MLEFERWQEPQLAINAALDRLQSRLWTKLPCVVTAVDLVNQLVTVQPTVMGVQRNVDASGNVTWSNIQLPLLPMVPIKYPSGTSKLVSVLPIWPLLVLLVLNSAKVKS